MTFSSRLSREAFNLGHRAGANEKSFDTWVARKARIDDLSSSFRAQLRRDYWRGADLYASERVKKSEIRERKPITSQKSSGGKPISYRGHNIQQHRGSFTVLGTEWRKLKDAQDYVDLYVASGGRVGKPNPSWTLRQGNAVAVVYETSPNHHTAEVWSGSRRKTESFTGPRSFESAKSWARLNLYEAASNPVKIRVTAPGARQNPMEPAQKMFEDFHGLPSKEILEYKEREHQHSVLWGVGPLVSMVVISPMGKEFTIYLKDPDSSSAQNVVMLACTENGRQLIPVGGDQKLSLESIAPAGFKEIDRRDHMALGTIVQITYRTKKSFELHGREAVDFYHDLGAEGSRGICPVLIYKPLNPSFEIAGGRYQVAKPERALGGVSPGIVG